MIHPTSLPAFSGPVQPAQRPVPAKPAQALVPQLVQAAPAVRPPVSAGSGVVPPSNTPRGSLLNLQV